MRNLQEDLERTVQDCLRQAEKSSVTDDQLAQVMKQLLLHYNAIKESIVSKERYHLTEQGEELLAKLNGKLESRGRYQRIAQGIEALPVEEIKVYNKRRDEWVSSKKKADSSVAQQDSMYRIIEDWGVTKACAVCAEPVNMGSQIVLQEKTQLFSIFNEFMHAFKKHNRNGIHYRKGSTYVTEERVKKIESILAL